MLVSEHIWRPVEAAPPPIEIPQLTTLGVTLTKSTGDKWRGLAVPLVRYKDGIFSSQRTSRLIKSAIIHIISTPKGSRLMRPEFGSVLPELLFEPNDAILHAKIRSLVVDDIQRQEPRVEDVELDVVANGNTLDVLIMYTIKETGERIEDHLIYNRDRPETIKLVSE